MSPTDPNRRLQPSRRRKRRGTLIISLVVVVVLIAAGGAWLLVGRTLSPIGLLSRQAKAASAESLRLHLNAPSEDAEIVELVSTLNGLLARLSETAGFGDRHWSGRPVT